MGAGANRPHNRRIGNLSVMESSQRSRTTAAFVVSTVGHPHTIGLTPSALAMLRARALFAALLPLVLAAGAAGQDRNGDADARRLLARASRLLLQEEMRGNCAGLTVTTKVHIDRLRELEKTAKKEREGPAVTMFGERPAVENAAKERERVEALNVVLDAKGCAPVNIEDELKKAPPPVIESKDASVKKAKLR
jgi:hypothetical protein